MMLKPAPRAQRGVTLIEALVALLVMAVGLLAFAGLHARLRLNSDVARERAEAVRLAQLDIENLRGFHTLTAGASTPGSYLTYAAIADGSVVKSTLSTDLTTNQTTTFTITRTVDSSDPRMKNLIVRYSWRDRRDDPQFVEIRSAIAAIDPMLPAALGIPANGTPIKDPLGRDLQVPIPAKDIGGGRSVYKPVSNGPMAFVFNNDSGRVTRRCDSSAVLSGLSTGQLSESLVQGTASDAYCQNVDGVIVSGFVRFSLPSSNPSAVNANDPPPNGGGVTMQVSLDDRAPPSGGVGYAEQLTAAYWAGGTPSASGYARTPDCGAEFSKTIRFVEVFGTPIVQVNNGTDVSFSSTVRQLIVPDGLDITAATAPATIAAFANLPNTSTIQSGSIAAAGERYVVYTCVVYPISLGGKLAWTGRVRVQPSSSAWALATSVSPGGGGGGGSTTTLYKVCRYTQDFDRDNQIWTVNAAGAVTRIDNAEHPYAYLQQESGLSTQNFLVIKSDETCPRAGTGSGSGNGDIDGTDGTQNTVGPTVRHQP